MIYLHLTSHSSSLSITLKRDRLTFSHSLSRHRKSLRINQFEYCCWQETVENGGITFQVKTLNVRQCSEVMLTPDRSGLSLYTDHDPIVSERLLKLSMPLRMFCKFPPQRLFQISQEISINDLCSSKWRLC